jgi:hypothetical protein
LAIWGDRWRHRGRQRHQCCMTRKDYQLPWVPDNTIIVTRAQHNQNQTINRARQGLCRLKFKHAL